MRLFCKHNYEIIHQETTKSLLEQGCKIDNMKGSGAYDILMNVISRKKIIIYKCKKCNKIKESIIKL